MHEYDLAGDHYEMGRRNAELMKRAGYPAQESVTESQLRFALECEEVVGEYAPWLVEEIRGVGDTGLWDPGVAKVLPLTLYADSGCSVVAVSGRHTRDGKPLFGRNYDFRASYRKYNSLYRIRPEGKLAHIGCADQWVGRHDGLNEAGLAIGQSGPPSNGQQPGVIGTLAMRAVLDTCRTVAEAVTFLERIPHISNNAFLLADAAGDIVAVDTSMQEVKVTQLAGGFGYLANGYVSEEMANYAPDEDLPGSGTRRRNIRSWFDARPEVGIGMGDIQRVLSDSMAKAGVCQCADEGEAAEDPGVTLWSWTAALGEPVMHLAKGTPNETPYEPEAL